MNHNISIVLLTLITHFFSSCSTRISRPPIVGKVYDSSTGYKINKFIIVTYSVDGALKEEYFDNGEFTIPLKTYKDFSIMTESPTEIFQFTIRKNGYKDLVISERSKYGFGRDTIFYDSLTIIKE